MNDENRCDIDPGQEVKLSFHNLGHDSDDICLEAVFLRIKHLTGKSDQLQYLRFNKIIF